jgi:hypothetical protein
MRKRIIQAHASEATVAGTDWLSLDEIATVEVTSEKSSYAIENALLYSSVNGWRAELPGEQIIRFIFDKPQALKRIWLLFLEREVERSQEFTLCWSPDEMGVFQDIVRQQWNFSPQGSVQEVEDYTVDLPGVKQLELRIRPNLSEGDTFASLAQLRLA